MLSVFGNILHCFGFRALAHLFAEGLELAARADMDEAHRVGDGGDDLVPVLGQIGGDAAVLCAERGKQQQSSARERALPFAGHATDSTPLLRTLRHPGSTPFPFPAKHRYLTLSGG